MESAQLVVSLDSTALAKLQSQYSELLVRQVLAPIVSFTPTALDSHTSDYVVLPHTMRRALAESQEPVMEGGASAVASADVADNIAKAAQHAATSTSSGAPWDLPQNTAVTGSPRRGRGSPPPSCSVMLFRLTKMFCGGCVARVTEGFQSHVRQNPEFTRLNGLSGGGSDLRYSGLSIVRFGNHLDYLVLVLPATTVTAEAQGVCLVAAREWWVRREAVWVVHSKCEKGIACVEPTTAAVSWQFQDHPLRGPYSLAARGDDYFTSRKQLTEELGTPGTGPLAEALASSPFVWWATASSIQNRTPSSSNSTTPSSEAMLSIGTSGLPATCVALLAESPLIHCVHDSADGRSVILILRPAADPQAVVSNLQQTVTRKGFGVTIGEWMGRSSPSTTSIARLVPTSLLPVTSPVSSTALRLTTVVLSVKGMSCQGCAVGLEAKILAQLGAVVAVKVSKSLDQAIITFTQEATADDMLQFIKEKYDETSVVTLRQCQPHHCLFPSSAHKNYPFNSFPIGTARDRRCDNPSCGCAQCECMGCICEDNLADEEMAPMGTSSVGSGGLPHSHSFDSSSASFAGKSRGGSLKKLTMTIKGMSCNGCAFGVATKMETQFQGRGLTPPFLGAAADDQPGVTSAGGAIVVDFPSSTGTFYYAVDEGTNAQPLSALEIEKFVIGLGYKVSNVNTIAGTPAVKSSQTSSVARTVIQGITGMTCPSCAARIQAKIEETPGVIRDSQTAVLVNFQDREAIFVHDTRRLSPADVVALISGMGYTGANIQESKPRPEPKAGAKTASPLPSPTTRNVLPIPTITGGGGKTESCSLVVQGMTCASCAFRIESSLSKLPYVSKSSVNFATAIAAIDFDVSKADPVMLSMFIEELGYSCVVQEPDADGGNEGSLGAVRDALERNDERKSYKSKFLMALPCAVFLFIINILSSPQVGWFPKLTTFLHSSRVGAVSYLDVIELTASSPVVLVFGQAFFIRAWSGLKHKAFTMDTLVAVGVGSAYGFSVLMMLAALCGLGTVKVYFDAAATLLTFMLLGKYLEAKAKKGTSGALVQLMSLAPATAIKVSMGANGEEVEEEVAVSQVHAKDIVRVPTGNRIPVDGVVTKGSSAVDESLITGESVPVDKTVGDKAIAGTLCLSSDIFISATQVGSKTMISRILRTVQDAQTTKPALQRLADKVAGVFVPIILCFATFTFILWITLSEADAYPAEWRNGNSKFIFSFSFFLSTIVVACPCAMGLATPTAVMVGTGIGATNGILIKDGPTLEKARKVEVVLFDKTGTLTEGELTVAVSRAYPLPQSINSSALPLSELEIKQIIGTVEGRSNHPIAQSLASNFGKLPSVQNLEVETHTGSGLSANVTFTRAEAASPTTFSVLIGKPKMIIKSGVPMDEVVALQIQEAELQGNTVIVAAIDKRVVLMAGLSDEPKDTAASCVWQLQEQGIEVFMVSGDQPAAAKAIAGKVGIPATNVHSEVLPWNKGDIVKEHQARGKVVAFVGDGLNDAPALAQADVGVALGAGTEVAIDSADAVLVKNSLQDLITFLDLSGTIIRRVYFNFAWAFGYNCVMLPIASGLLFPMGWRMQMPPVVAGGLMVCSSLTVLGSSLALKLYRPPLLKKDGAVHVE